MAGLLAGTRILDLTNVLAGPFCCYQLAQLGADVIKVEAPGTGDLARQLGADPELNRRLMGASFLAQNAGKQSITLNLKHPKGREAFMGDRITSAAADPGGGGGAGQQDRAHRLGGDAATTGLPARGCGGLGCRSGALELAREQ